MGVVSQTRARVATLINSHPRLTAGLTEMQRPGCMATIYIATK
jgi:hypothetical protein